MASAIDFEGNMATPDMVEFVQMLYSNVQFPDHTNETLIIPITGDKKLLDAFLNFVSNYDLTHLGYKSIVFVEDDTSKHIILDDDHEQNMNDILFQYIDF